MFSMSVYIFGVRKCCSQTMENGMWQTWWALCETVKKTTCWLVGNERGDIELRKIRNFWVVGNKRNDVKLNIRPTL